MLVGLGAGAAIAAAPPETWGAGGSGYPWVQRPAPLPTFVAPNPDDLARVAEDAWVYGYPLVLTEVTRRQSTNVAVAGSARAPLGQFARASALPSPSSRGSLRPNVDTLNASAWVDLAGEPVVLHVPDTYGRYYVVPIVDAWARVVASIGSRTTGTAAGDYALVGPGWAGSLPAGVQVVRVATADACVLARVWVQGAADLSAARSVLDQLSLTPLARWQTWGAAGAVSQPPAVDPRLEIQEAPPEIVAGMDGPTYFGLLASLMSRNPPAEADAVELGRFAAIGLVSGQPFRGDTLSPAAREAVDDAAPRARMRLRDGLASSGREMNGWRAPSTVPGGATDTDARAVRALAGPDADRAEDALTWTTNRDDRGRPIDGNNAYVLTFSPGQDPPARAFWSLTMYDGAGYLVANPMGRHAMGSRDVLTRAPDGSLQLVMQHAPPMDGATNWLPAPSGAFSVTLRMYWPDPAALQGGWAPPALHRMDEGPS